MAVWVAIGGLCSHVEGVDPFDGSPKFVLGAEIDVAEGAVEAGVDNVDSNSGATGREEGVFVMSVFLVERGGEEGQAWVDLFEFLLDHSQVRCPFLGSVSCCCCWI